MDQLRLWFSNYEKDLEKARNFWQGKGRYLVSVYPTAYDYRQIFNDDQILTKVPKFLEAQAGLPGLNLPSLYCDWGTVSTARHWGGEVRFDSTGGNIFIDPAAQTIDEALAIDPLPIDHPSLDVHRALQIYRRASDLLGPNWLWLRTPDQQGVLNTAGLIMNQEEFFIAMYSDKQKVHAFLSQVTDYLIEMALYLRQQSGNQICGNIWPNTFFPDDFGISLTEDMMPLMSAKLYKEFGIPNLKRISEAFGGLHIHCCGQWGRHAPNLKAAELNIRAVEFHYPFTTLEELAILADEVVFIPYIMLDQQDRFQSVSEYYRYLLEKTNPDYRWWFACAEDTPEMLDFAQEYAYE